MCVRGRWTGWICCITFFGPAVEESGGWSEHRTRDGYSYYHNSQSGESQWERPEGFSGQSQELSREEIQVGGGDVPNELLD